MSLTLALALPSLDGIEKIVVFPIVRRDARLEIAQFR